MALISKRMINDSSSGVESNDSHEKDPNELGIYVLEFVMDRGERGR